MSSNYGATKQTLMLGDLRVGGTIDVEQVIAAASDEMDIRLGQFFVLPLPLSGFPAHIQAMFKLIQSRLASARIIYPMASPQEDADLHRYAVYLEQLAMGDLALICGGSVQLPGAVQLDGNTANGPSIYNRDGESAIDMFESAFMRSGSSAYWEPGPLR